MKVLVTLAIPKLWSLLREIQREGETGNDREREREKELRSLSRYVRAAGKWPRTRSTLHFLCSTTTTTLQRWCVANSALFLSSLVIYAPICMHGINNNSWEYEKCSYYICFLCQFYLAVCRLAHAYMEIASRLSPS
jgi:hypothetical protein